MAARPPRRQWAPWRRAYEVTALLASAVFVAWSMGQWGGPFATRVFILASTTAAAVLAAALAFARRRRVDRERGLRWAFLGAACASWAMGNIVWSAYELLLRPDVLPFPSLADAFYLLFVPVAATGVLQMASHGLRPTTRLRLLLDGLLIATSMLFMARALLLRPLLRFAGQQETALAQALAVAYPVGDIALLSLVVLAASRVRRELYPPLAWTGAAVLAITVADIGFWYQTAVGVYGAGAWTDAGWIACFLLLGRAALRDLPDRPIAPEPAPGLLVAALPLLPFLVALVVSWHVQLTEGYLEPFLFWNAVAVIALLATRQFVVLLENIRLRRTTEAALAGLQQATSLRTRMLNTVTHDLLSPLSPVRLQLRILEQRDAPPERVQRSLAVIRRNLDQVERLGRDLKEVANLESDELLLQRAPLDLGLLCQQAHETFLPVASEAGVRLLLTCPDGLWVDGDRGRIVQVLHNLLSNAVRFTPRGGSVEVVARAAGPAARVEVRDSGRGLDPGEQARLFQPFVQVHERDEAAERGTGLGLYISRVIVERHGGRIGVHSAGRGLGSAFWFELPARREPVAS
jgi:signal transduction histidine kinase